MISLVDAIYSKWTATGLSSIITGNLHADDVAKVSATGPYMVYTIVSAPVNNLFNHYNPYEARIQFTLIGGSAQTSREVGVMMEQFTTAFDNSTLTLATQTNYDMRRLTEPMPLPYDAASVDVSAGRYSAWMVQYAFAVF